MSLLAQLINYTKNPTLETNFNPKYKFWTIFKLAGLFFTLTFLASLPQEYFLKIVGFDVKDHLIVQSLRQDPYFIVFFSSVLFAPVFEEISYRLWLKPTFWNLTIGFGFLFSNVFGILLPLNLLFDNLPILSLEIYLATYFLLTSVISIFIVGILLLLFEKLIKSSNTKLKLNSGKFKFAYYSSVILFGLVHAFNYDITKVWLIAPILVLPQLLLGFYFGFVRMNLGFKWSIIAHALHNLILIFPILLFSEATKSIQDQMQVSNDLIPNLIYSLPQSDQNLYFIGLFCYGLVTFCSFIVTCKIFYEYYKSRRKTPAENKTSV
jgi:Type II CAAX prenyl endopeptidase Rce1-like